MDRHRIVIVGGGAGGLELATRLGDTLGKRGMAAVTLIDRKRTHLWKPLLHEVAAGSMDIDEHELEYLAQARWHHFRYRLGAMDGLDRKSKEITVAASLDEEGREVILRRRFGYDTLVIAVGSTTNDFGTPGVMEHAISLDTTDEAERFHRKLVNACLRAHARPGPISPGELDVAIVGGGATGVELAAELHKTVRELAAYGLDQIDPDKDIRITIIEANDRILSALPERISNSAEKLLETLGVKIRKGERVVRVTEKGVECRSGKFVPAGLVVWAAGIKAPDFLRGLDGLETNSINQLVVKETLQTTNDPDIFALGDCSACRWKGQTVPPRAQAAHQQASLLVKSLSRRLGGKSLPEYRYRDFGSLVSLGEYSTVGSLMGGLSGGNMMVEGYFARLMYLSLYRMHLVALHGYPKALLDSLARFITRRTEPHIKLH